MFQQKKAYSAVTVAIENLTSESYQEDDFSGIPELVDVIKLQASGPTEAARAIRKKLKYGNAHRQIRALVILDGLILNAGQQFQRTFADEPLLERLRVCGTSDLSDPEVKKKCRELFRGWASYGSVKGLERISVLHKELPKRKVGVTQERSKAVRETDANPFGDDEEEEAARVSRQAAAGSPAGPSFSRRKEPPAADAFTNPKTSSSSSLFFGSSSKDKKKDKSRGKKKPFSLEQEKEQIKTVIAESSLATTNLLNALQSINREKERISENQMAVQQFEACKQLRRRVLRYVHHVEEEQWLGGLLHANDELVHALMSFEQMDHSIDADSDSDDEIAEQAHLYRMVAGKAHQEPTSPASHAAPDISGLSLDSSAKPAVPPRPPVSQAPPRPPLQTRKSRESWESDEQEEDEDDPFADKNVVETPAAEKGEPRWR